MISFGLCCMHLMLPKIFLRDLLWKPEKETNHSVLWERPGLLKEWRRHFHWLREAFSMYLNSDIKEQTEKGMKNIFICFGPPFFQ